MAAREGHLLMSEAARGAQPGDGERVGCRYPGRGGTLARRLHEGRRHSRPGEAVRRPPFWAWHRHSLGGSLTRALFY